MGWSTPLAQGFIGHFTQLCSNFSGAKVVPVQISDTLFPAYNLHDLEQYSINIYIYMHTHTYLYTYIHIQICTFNPLYVLKLIAAALLLNAKPARCAAAAQVAT